MARIGQLFGGRGVTDRDGDGDKTERTADRNRDRDGKRTERTADRKRDGSGERTERIAARDRDGAGDRGATAMRPTIDREPISPPAPPVTKPDAEAVTRPAPVRQAPARVSLLATCGLMLGVAGVAVALTGLLAPWAIAVGALGLLFSFGGIIAGVRPNVAGRGLGTLGVLFSGTAVVFAILAMTGQVSWLDSHTDQVARLKDWLDARLPWMKDW
ncbi:hypothetical protein [Dactylosporangium sp. NPDC048998]|uniref:hypothetical protein n=1 Tax=Dactylosporangium sp. NPDC048998 TaxID=3363976 RepID=UPI0037190AE4